MNGALSCPGFKWSLLPNEYFMHFWALCLQSNFFVPSNFEKCLETVPCKGIYSVIILFTRDGLKFFISTFSQRQLKVVKCICSSYF